MTIALIAGARPNFIKIAPIIKEFEQNQVEYTLIHTGQHYDYDMSKVFFEQLSLPEPDYYLGIGSGSHNYQIAHTMLSLEKVFTKIQPYIVVVVGDVNSTLAGALSAVKAGFPVAHIEAGLRSFDKTMPEEINRILTDSISDFLFTTCLDANENLLREGITSEKIHFVGNVMIDTLLMLKEYIDSSKILEQFGLIDQPFIYITLHRPSNVDVPSQVDKIANALTELSGMGIKIIFPIHPRTKANLKNFGLLEKYDKIPNLIITQPLGYVDAIALMQASKAVITDSGGVQEETTFLGIPCLTLRPNTERPITIKIGTNTLLHNGPDMIPEEVDKILKGNFRKGSVPELWDGKAAKRIVRVLKSALNYN